jgi:hybrid polyketide synthase / nonribosomal peptide synthetase ACE1
MTGLSLYNLYGSTETSLAATGMLVPFGVSDAPIAAGTPLPNYSLYVLDSQLRVMLTGVQGEVYIGGAGVGLGYLNRAEQTTMIFIPNIFATAEDKLSGWYTMHRTGDLGRWKEDGTLLIEGRIDTQVKLRGLRIDLSEIEQVILSATHGAVCEVAVALRKLKSDQSEFLVAYVVFQAGVNVESETAVIRSRLKERLHYTCVRPLSSVYPCSPGQAPQNLIAGF